MYMQVYYMPTIATGSPIHNRYTPPNKQGVTLGATGCECVHCEGARVRQKCDRFFTGNPYAIYAIYAELRRGGGIIGDP